jgi:uncharacterized membrane protein YdcZ (DUF606 family)
MSRQVRSFQENLDRASWWSASAGIVAITVVFALLYLIASSYPGHGLKLSDSTERVSFWTCLYFSVVTESTLGAGDISAVGFSRMIVSIQVLFGLIIAGILIAKVLSAPVSEAARIGRMVKGAWVDRVSERDGTRILGVTRLQVQRNGLCFEGEDYRTDGTLVGSFESEVVAISGSTATFTYKSHSRLTNEVTRGVSTLTFSNEIGGKFSVYSIIVEDFSGHCYSGQGFRLDASAIADQLARPDQHSMAIHALVALFD